MELDESDAAVPPAVNDAFDTVPTSVPPIYGFGVVAGKILYVIPYGPETMFVNPVEENEIGDPMHSTAGVTVTFGMVGQHGFTVTVAVIGVPLHVCPASV